MPLTMPDSTVARKLASAGLEMGCFYYVVGFEKNLAIRYKFY
jgi:hypothetical protein